MTAWFFFRTSCGNDVRSVEGDAIATVYRCGQRHGAEAFYQCFQLGFPYRIYTADGHERISSA
jgi:hypothetical protein